jgi:hypothetical protein
MLLLVRQAYAESSFKPCRNASIAQSKCSGAGPTAELQRRTAAQLRPENSALFRAFDARQEFGEVPFKPALLVAATTTATSCFGDSEAVFRMLRRWES